MDDLVPPSCHGGNELAMTCAERHAEVRKPLRQCAEHDGVFLLRIFGVDVPQDQRRIQACQAFLQHQLGSRDCVDNGKVRPMVVAVPEGLNQEFLR